MSEEGSRLPWWALGAHRAQAWFRTVVSALAAVVCLVSVAFTPTGGWLAGAVFFALLTVAGVATIIWLGRNRPPRAREDRAEGVNRAAPRAGRARVHRRDPE